MFFLIADELERIEEERAQETRRRKKETRSEAFLVNVPRMRSPRLQETCHVAVVKDGLLISPCASGSASAAGRSFVH